MATRRVVVERCGEPLPTGAEYVVDYVTTGPASADPELPLWGTLDRALEIGMRGVDLDVLDPRTLAVVVSVRGDEDAEIEPCPPTLRNC